MLNLCIASAAFLRGLPFLHNWVLDRMPVGKPVREQDRLTIAAILSAQLVGGAALAGLSIYFIVVYLVPVILPGFGAILRDFAEDLAAYNAPARLIIWLAGGR